MTRLIARDQFVQYLDNKIIRRIVTKDIYID